MLNTDSANHQDYSGNEEDDEDDNASHPPPLPTALSAHELVGSNLIHMFIAASDKLKKRSTVISGRDLINKKNYLQALCSFPYCFIRKTNSFTSCACLSSLTSIDGAAASLWNFAEQDKGI